MRRKILITKKKKVEKDKLYRKKSSTFKYLLLIRHKMNSIDCFNKIHTTFRRFVSFSG